MTLPNQYRNRKNNKKNKYWSILPLMGALKDLSENATCDVRI